MAQFSPQFTIYQNRNNRHKFGYEERSKVFVFSTYAELKQKMKSIMKEYYNDELCVSRQRRGEWGEWFEWWHLEGGIVTKGKEGWM